MISAYFSVPRRIVSEEVYRAQFILNDTGFEHPCIKKYINVYIDLAMISRSATLATINKVKTDRITIRCWEINH
jgi:hypothetical protein